MAVAVQQPLLSIMYSLSLSLILSLSLSLSLSLQFYVAALGDRASPQVRSAADPLIRPVSSGSQSYETKPENYPVTQPMTKLAAKLQVQRSIQAHKFHSLAQQLKVKSTGGSLDNQTWQTECSCVSTKSKLCCGQPFVCEV